MAQGKGSRSTVTSAAERRSAQVGWIWRTAVMAGVANALMGCSGASPAPAPPCDSVCMDQVALRSIRESMKLVFNLTIQGKPAGPQDTGIVPCPLGGTAHIFGTATSNAVQGATNVQLTYVLDKCAYSQQSTTLNENYNMSVTGQLQETGVLAVQPTSTTALEISSDSVTMSGTVYDPPVNYSASDCPLMLGQNGNNLSGLMCGRSVGLTL